jgi:hypothetical protein
MEQVDYTAEAACVKELKKGLREWWVVRREFVAVCYGYGPPATDLLNKSCLGREIVIADMALVVDNERLDFVTYPAPVSSLPGG